MGVDTQEVINTGYAPEVKPFIQSVMGRTQALFAKQKYEKYTGKRFADFTPTQQKYFEKATKMGVDPRTLNAATLTNKGIKSLLNQKYGQSNFARKGTAVKSDKVDTKSFTPETAQDFMSPYMERVIASQQRDAQRQAAIAGTERGAKAVQAGAFGGSRQAIMDAEAARNLALQQGDIQATGLQKAYEAAQQQFNQEEQSNLTAQRSNQQTGLQAAIQNQANRLDRERADEASRQYGANYAYQGRMGALQGAGQLGNIGRDAYGQKVGNLGLMKDVGGMQQGYDQHLLNVDYQNELDRKNFPLDQLQLESNLYRGLVNDTNQRSMYSSPPSMTNQLLGAGAMYYGAQQQQQQPRTTTSIGLARGGMVPSGLMNLAMYRAYA